MHEAKMGLDGPKGGTSMDNLYFEENRVSWLLDDEVARHFYLSQRIKFYYTEYVYNIHQEAPLRSKRGVVVARDIDHAQAIVHANNIGTSYTGDYFVAADFYVAPGELAGPVLL